jgi:hypothetical protein
MRERSLLKYIFPGKFNGEYLRNRKNYDDLLLIGYYAVSILTTICCVAGYIALERRKIDSKDIDYAQPYPLVLNPRNTRVYLPVILK